MAYIEKKIRETVDGIEYNVTYIRGNNSTSIVYDPVRTPEQQAKRDETLRIALSRYCRSLLERMGEEWCLEHLAVEEE